MKISGFVVRLSVVAVLLTFGLALMAQSEQQGGPPQGRRMMMSPEERLERLSKELDLTDDQKAKLKPIFEAEADKMKALREDTSMSREDRRAKMMEIQQKSSEDIKAVLTKDQQKKYDEMRQRMMERRGPGGPAGEKPPEKPPSL